MSITCPLCNPDPARVFLVRQRLLGIWDAYPVTPGHALVIPTRHFPDLAGATAEERQGLWDLVDPVMKVIAKQHGPVDGFNIGINGGEAAGQTVPHLHMHIIPRRRGDTASGKCADSAGKCANFSDTGHADAGPGGRPTPVCLAPEATRA